MADLRDRIRSYQDYTPPRRHQSPVKGVDTVTPDKIIRDDPIDALFNSSDNNLFDPPKKKKRKKKSKKRGKKLLIFLIVLLFLGGVGGAVYSWKKHLGPFKKQKSTTSAQNAPAASAPSNAAAETPQIIRIVATGDMTPYSAILKSGDKGGGAYDFTPMFSGLSQYFAKSDVRFCSQPTPSGGTGLGISGYPTFNAPAEWQKAIAGVGCNLVSLASDNINDKGQAGIDATSKAWADSQNMFAVAGANKSADEQTKINTFTIKGMKFAYLAYTTSSKVRPAQPFSVNIYSEALATSQITEARKLADFVIVAMHWGKEDSSDVTPEQENIATQLANMGTNVVLGVGSHQLQPAKVVKGSNGNETLVWFSLGNSLNAQLPVESLIGGLAVMDIDAKSKKVMTNFMPVYVHYEWTAEQKKSQDFLARKNFSLYALSEAATPLAGSQNGTTVEAQTERVKQIMNKFTQVTMLTSAEFLSSSPVK